MTADGQTGRIIGLSIICRDSDLDNPESYGGPGVTAEVTYTVRGRRYFIDPGAGLRKAPLRALPQPQRGR